MAIANAIAEKPGLRSPFVSGIDSSESRRVSSSPSTAMPAWPFIRRCLTICIVLLVGVEGAFAQTVGTVTNVQKQAQVGSRPAVTGAPVNMNVELRTGIGARLQNTFIDDTTLTLGENARVVVDRYVFNPHESTGAMALKTTTGAIRFATGQLNKMRNKDITVTTPHAALAVRGTEFWMGPIDGHHGALLLKGKVCYREGDMDEGNLHHFAARERKPQQRCPG